MNRKRATSAESELSDAALRRLTASKPGVRAVRIVPTTEVQTAAWVRLKCRHPHEARPAMEACGIDVFSTVRRVRFKIGVMRTMDQGPNGFGLVLVIDHHQPPENDYGHE
jgi:hypothetical protein